MEANPKKGLIFENTSLMDNSFTILLVEDNPGDVVIIKELLKSTGVDFSLKHVSTLRETILLCVEKVFDIVLLDLGLPDSIGLETLKKIQVFNVKSPVIVMTGLDDEDIALESIREGAQDYLVKSRLTSDNILRGIKYGIERKKIQDLLKKNARQFSLLSSTTTAINESEDVSPIYTVICRNISMLLEKAGLIAFDFTEDGKIHSLGLESIEPWIDQIKLITGLNLHDPLLYSGELKKEILDLFNDGKVHNPTNDFNPVAPPALRETPQERRKLSGINIYTVGFMKGSTVYGGVLIFSQNTIGVDDINIIETVSNQVSLSLHRRSIEQDLKMSETRYRKLSKELEIKVKERTRDLEHLNYQLNQELIERHLAEEALKRSETRLKELNATKDKFFSIIAHDLKNPFTCLLGSTELLSEKINQMDKEQVRELVQILNDSAKSGYEILQNLLDWSRSQTGMLTYNPGMINLKQLIDDNISDLRLPSSKKEIIVFSDVKGEMPVFSDKNIINAVLRNLLNNAIKFTHRFGTIKISAVNDGNEVTVSVADTGIGIPEKNINDLFRIDTKYSRPGTGMEQGTGLGLKICKEFVEMQGGKIWVESIVNEGSEFIFTVPAFDRTTKRG
jgi:signal transduction histidine kinase/DNA-binding NarL/FixJ family response regulator